MTYEGIMAEYHINQKALEAEYFDFIITDGKSRRVLKDGMDIDEFYEMDAILWADTQALIDALPVEPTEIEAVTERVDDLETFTGSTLVPPYSTISAVVLSINLKEPSCMVDRIYKDVHYQFKALVTSMVADKLGKDKGVIVGDTVIVTYLDHAPVGTLPIIVDKIAAIIYPL